MERAVQQPRVVVALHHVQGVGDQVLAGDKPGLVFTTATLRTFFFEASNAQTLALAQGVKTQAHMRANLAATFVFDGAGFVGDVAVEELAKGALTDEANAGGVFFLGVGQTNLIRNAAHFGFVQLAHREQGFRQLRLV